MFTDGQNGQPRIHSVKLLLMNLLYRFEPSELEKILIKILIYKRKIKHLTYFYQGVLYVCLNYDEGS